MMRLPYSPIQLINHEKELSFSYRGRVLKGLAGDTIATALFANGTRIFSRSLKYHRPRGLYNLDGYSSNCLMSVDGEPNVRTCITPLRAGMVVKPQNVIGSPEWDLMSLFQWFSFAMPAGFYYKRFHKPAWIWPPVQRLLRWLAGPGRLDPNMTNGIYDNKYLNAEICVIGGGLAGMVAALTAAKAGIRVVLIESRGYLGGELRYHLSPLRNHVPGYLYASSLEDEVHSKKNIRILLDTHVSSIYQSNHITAVQQGRAEDHFRLRYYEIRARNIIVATGGIEIPFIFQNNDCPGIMQGSCARQLIHKYALKPGERAVVSGCDNRMLELAADLTYAGVDVLAVADTREGGFGEGILNRFKELDIPFYPGYMPKAARQLRTLSSVTLQKIDGNKEIRFKCDLLVTSAGEIPLSQLLHTAGVPMAFDPKLGRFLPKELPPGLNAAGRVLGHSNRSAIEAQGELSGLIALEYLGVDVSVDLKAARERLYSLTDTHSAWGGFHFSKKGHMRFLDLDEDVTVDQIDQAMEQGFDQPELIKRYTAIGTGPSQSYLSGYNLAMLVAHNKGLDPGEISQTTIRPPVVPTSLASLGGRKYRSFRHTPLHEKQQEIGAIFRLVGEWERAAHFGDEDAIEEILNVRNNVGFIDISTLGKFRVYGRDALKLLQRVYVGDMTKVEPGKLTYSVMCNEEGVVIDDGVVTKLDGNDYFFTTSTARAPHTIEWLKFHSRNEDWDVNIINLTDALAAINLAGPRSREVLGRLTDADISNESFPYMTFRKIILCGDIEAMIARIGFVGELCYEIHIPSSYGPAFHEAIIEVGKSFAIKPFGLEAQSVLRLEKGHAIIVVDTDNHTTLHEMGLSRIWAKHKTDAKTVGLPALRFAEKQAHRQKLVGFTMINEQEGPPPDGAIIVDDSGVKGRVCSSRFSPTLNKPIGMALVDPEIAILDENLKIYTDRRLGKNYPQKVFTSEAKITTMPFYDPKGHRVRM